MARGVRPQHRMRSASTPAFRPINNQQRNARCHALQAGTTLQLPIFPLGVVALPSASVPLQIFEPRYRVLFNTLLDGAEGVEEGLVQKDSPFCGARRFGMCFLDGDGRLASIGTVLDIQEHVHLKVRRGCSGDGFKHTYAACYARPRLDDRRSRLLACPRPCK